MNDDLPSDHAFSLYLRTVDLDTVRLEATARMSHTEWQILGRTNGWWR